MSDSQDGYIVAYARISIDKTDGVILQGVYFGGFGFTQDEAEQLAKDCVNTVKGKTVVPKIMQLTSTYNIIDAMYDACDRFESMVEKMREVDSIMNRETD